MPNWCSNWISVRGTDSQKVQALADAFDRGELLQTVIPIPECLKDTTSPVQPGDEAAAEARQQACGYTDWYSFCTNRWGTKWDINIGDVCERDEDGLGFSGHFDTAWAPPTGVLEELVEQGYTVTCYYHESGMAFVGKFEDGIDDYYEYSGENSQSVRDAIGDDLDDFWGISEQMAEYEAENEEEDLTVWIKDGAEKRKLMAV